jgi:hypothetical protein
MPLITQFSLEKAEGFLCVCFFFETGFKYVAQAGLELMIFLSQLPQYRNYRPAPLLLAGEN